MINAAIVGMGWWGKTLVESVQGSSDVIRFVAGASRTPSPELSLSHAVTIKTPEGALTIPAGTRVKLKERSPNGIVTINYQGYSAPVPSNALVEVQK